MELMIVVAIIGIIAAIAYPSFIEQIRKSRRADAKASLEALALNQEKWRANHATYGALADVWSGTASNEGHYTIAQDASVTITGTAYRFKATPVGDQANDRCGTFAIDQDGPFESDAYAAVNGCWR